MASLTYNGIELTQVKITSFVTTNEFEGDNFNRTGRKNSMTGIGIVSGAFVATLANIKNTLSIPGEKLEIKFSGDTSYTTLADGAAGATSYDAKNGPLPEINVTEIAGVTSGAAFVVSFTFNWFDCGASAVQRFEQITTHSINSEGAVTITRRGYIRVSAANSASGNTFVEQSGINPSNPYGNPIAKMTAGKASMPNNADLYRRLIANLTPAGYQRTRENYYVGADQLTLAFEIEDTQLNRYIPWPALDGDGSFEYERGLDDSNFQGTKRFRIELTGAPTTSTADLFMTCVDVALTRIRFAPPYPDIIQSFKISEPSLLKRNSVGLEIVALGTPTSAKFEPTGSTDEWLYYVLFTPPTATARQIYNRDPYGVQGQGWVSVAPKIRFDVCTLGPTWTSYLPTDRGYSVTTIEEEGASVEPIAGSSGDPITHGPVNTPDEQLGEDAKKIVRYESSQTISEETNMNFITPMGWGIQYGFHFALPEVVIHQEVLMVTRDVTMPIPWPYVSDAFVVIKKRTSINDAPPDASGNRLFGIFAERDIKVSVWNSPNMIVTSNNSAQMSNAVAGSGTLSRAVWSPATMPTSRHPVTGNNVMDLRENIDGQVQRQDYVSNISPGGSEG